MSMFTEYLNERLRFQGVKKRDIAQVLNISVSYLYKVSGGHAEITSRDLLLGICIVAKFTIEETNKLLLLNGMPILTSADARDMVIVRGIMNHKRYRAISADLRNAGMQDFCN